jgi:hypothetical protein
MKKERGPKPSEKMFIAVFRPFLSRSKATFLFGECAAAASMRVYGVGSFNPNPAARSIYALSDAGILGGNCCVLGHVCVSLLMT